MINVTPAFISNLDKSIHPCNHCFQFDKWVPRNMYIQEAAKPLSEAIKEWVDCKDEEYGYERLEIQ